MDTVATPKHQRFLNLKPKKKLKFLDEPLDIVKLSVAQVNDLREFIDGLESDDPEREFKALCHIIKLGAPDLEEVDDFSVWPVDDLTKLANSILEYAGMTQPTEVPKK